MAKVVLKNVCMYFGEVKAVEDASFEIEDGSFFTFLGPSGCGKTTTLRMIAGFNTPSKGEIFIGEDEVTNLVPERRNVGMVFQSYALFPHMTVYENVAYGLKIRKMRATDISEKVDKYLKLVQLNGYQNRKITELSGGQQQRVALARSMAIEPKVLLLDEPLSNLDARMRDDMRVELKILQKQLGITTIFVTHDQTEALTMSDKIAVFNNGRCQQIGSPREIYDSPANSFVAKFIGNTNLFPVTMSDGKLIIQGKISLVADSKKTGNYISIKPEHIELSKTPANETNSLKAVVKHAQFNGMDSHYMIMVEGVEFRVIQINNRVNTQNFQTDEQIYANITPSNIYLLEE